MWMKLQVNTSASPLCLRFAQQTKQTALNTSAPEQRDRPIKRIHYTRSWKHTHVATHTRTHTTINAQNSIRQPPGGAKTSSTSVYHPLSSKRIGAAGGMGILNVLTANSSQLVTELIKTEQQCATVYHNMNQQVACPSALIGICSAEFHTGILPSSTRLVV